MKIYIERWDVHERKTVKTHKFDESMFTVESDGFKFTLSETLIDDCIVLKIHSNNVISITPDASNLILVKENR